MNFREYAVSKGIFELENGLRNINKLKIYTNEFICEHCNIIFDLHDRLKLCSIPLNNLFGKIVEDFKTSKLILKEDIARYSLNSENEIEKNISTIGRDILDRIDKIIDVIDKSNYKNMVFRSYKKKEVCVGNVSLSSIYINSSSKIFVRSFGYFCQNILEYDYVKLFTRLKRMGRDVDIIKCCSYVCGKEDFCIDSYNFILACVSFPYEFLRVVCRYRDIGGRFAEKIPNVDFKYILNKDGQSLV